MTYNVFSGTLNPTHFTSPPKGQSPPIFESYLFWPDGWMD